MNADHPLKDLTPCLPAGMRDTLMRAQEALELIALITHEVAQKGRIHVGHISTLASYVNEDLDTLLTNIERVPEM